MGIQLNFTNKSPAVFQLQLTPATTARSRRRAPCCWATCMPCFKTRTTQPTDAKIEGLPTWELDATCNGCVMKKHTLLATWNKRLQKLRFLWKLRSLLSCEDQAVRKHKEAGEFVLGHASDNWEQEKFCQTSPILKGQAGWTMYQTPIYCTSIYLKIPTSHMSENHDSRVDGLGTPSSASPIFEVLGFGCLSADGRHQQLGEKKRVRQGCFYVEFNQFYLYVYMIYVCYIAL